MRGDAARRLLPALLVLALVAVVAVAATGSTDRGTDRTRPPSSILLDTIVALGVLWLLAGAAILVWAFLHRKELGGHLTAGRRRTSPVTSLLVFFLLIAAAVAWQLRDRRASEGGSEGTVLAPGEPEGATPPPPPGYDPSLTWITVVVVVALALAALVAYAAARRRERRLEDRDEVLAGDLAEALDESLADLVEEADPRLAVVAAYARLEKVLAAHGVPRRAAETPDEYLARVLSSLDIHPASVRRLTDLYSWAKFSQHDVVPRMKADAVRALETVRDELRRLRETREGAEAPAVPIGAAS